MRVLGRGEDEKRLDDAHPARKITVPSEGKKTRGGGTHRSSSRANLDREKDQCK